jgi:hypothetical protein
MSNENNTAPKTIYLLMSGHLSAGSVKLMSMLEDYKVYLVTDLKNIKDDAIVIPCTVIAQTMLYKSDIYNILDNKSSFYRYLTENCKDSLDNIRLIPSYDKEYKGPNKYATFLIKPNDGHGSQNQIKETGYVYDIISKREKNNQIQDIIDLTVIYELDFICKDGNIIGSIFHQTEASNRTPLDYVFGIYCTQITNLPDGMIDICTNIIKNTNYNGFIEFEFIKDVNGVIYIMECNPRLSGLVCNPYYFKNLIGPYYNIQSRLCNTLIKSTSYNCNKKIRLFDPFQEIYGYTNYRISRFLDSLNLL